MAIIKKAHKKRDVGDNKIKAAINKVVNREPTEAEIFARDSIGDDYIPTIDPLIFINKKAIKTFRFRKAINSSWLVYADMADDPFNNIGIALRINLETLEAAKEWVKDFII